MQNKLNEYLLVINGIYYYPDGEIIDKDEDLKRLVEIIDKNLIEF